MYFIAKTSVYQKWITKLKDLKARALITERIDRVVDGLLGDAVSIGDGVSELKIHYGPGYRVYFSKREMKIILLLCGGDKSTQNRDIVVSKKLLKKLESKKWQ